MGEIKQISSLQNPLVKKVVSLKEKSRERKKTGLFVFEGFRELQLALLGKFHIESLLLQPDLISVDKVADLLKEQGSNAEIIAVTPKVYQKMAYRETTEGVIAVAKSKSSTLNELRLTAKNSLVLVAEAPEKPGNIGALLRTADAANVDAVIIANAKTDLYNPNIIRSSVGCIFTNKIATGSTSEIIAFLKKGNIQILCAALSAATKYTDVDYKRASAIVVGTESTGLSQVWLKNSHQNIIIPMQGAIDSMNVSVCAGILIFEAKRQRDFS